jgi:hypothetical protein
MRFRGKQSRRIVEVITAANGACDGQSFVVYKYTDTGQALVEETGAFYQIFEPMEHPAISPLTPRGVELEAETKQLREAIIGLGERVLKLERIGRDRDRQNYAPGLSD